jgi:hypothetical protein
MVKGAWNGRFTAHVQKTARIDNPQSHKKGMNDNETFCLYFIGAINKACSRSLGSALENRLLDPLSKLYG